MAEIYPEALFSIQYGLYVITARCGERLNGQIANVLFQVTSDPAQVVTCLHKDNLTHDMVRDSGLFGASILEQDTPMTFIGTFGYKSGRDVNKFDSVNYETGSTGLPLITDYASSVIEARVVSAVDVGTHTLFIGKVESSHCVKHCPAMTYEYYHTIKKGKSPEKAPTFGISATKTKKRSPGMKKYVCDICGYVYDPANGDPDNGVQPGTAFENIADDWVCPVCGVGKDQFSEE